MSNVPVVAIVGAGFGGLRLVKHLARTPVHIVLIDKRNYHTFQPLLYQVATAALDPEEIGHNVRGIFHKQRNVSFRLGEVVDVDWDRRVLQFIEGKDQPFDYLILAAGAVTADFGVNGVTENAFGLKSMEEAVHLRSHIMRQFELADADSATIEHGALNFVVVGGGATGVEMAGALAEWFDKVMRSDFPKMDHSKVKLLLVEATDRLLAPYAADLRVNARKTLEQRGVQVLLNESVLQVTPDTVHLRSGQDILTHTVIWGAGVKANPIGSVLGLELVRGGRVAVRENLSVANRERVYVIGDMAGSVDGKGNPLPQVAQVAIQGAIHVAQEIQRELRGEASKPFRFKDPGSMATIGRNAAVAQLPTGWRFTGFIAWMMWLFLHLMYLVGFRNRLNVFINWLWNYITYDRSPRLIMNPIVRNPPADRNAVTHMRLFDENQGRGADDHLRAP